MLHLRHHTTQQLSPRFGACLRGGACWCARQGGAGGVQDRQLVRKRAGLAAEHGGLSEGDGGGDGGGVVAVERPRRGTDAESGAASAEEESGLATPVT